MIRTLSSFIILVLTVTGANLIMQPSAHAGQYIGGELNLSVDDPENVRFIAADVSGSVKAGGNLSGMAADITLDLSVEGNVELLGADISLTGHTNSDVSIAGADITLDLIIENDLDAAGADLELLQRVGGDASMAGALISIHKDASIVGRAELAAREIYIAGHLKGGSQIRGREVYIDGTLHGDVVIHARDVRFGDAAVVTGSIKVYAPNAPELGEAQIENLDFVEENWDEDSYENWEPNIDLDFLPSLWAISGIFSASAFLLGLFVVLLAPQSAARIARNFRERPFVSGFLGLIVLALLPIVTLTLFALLLITVIGIPLAVLLLLAMPIVLFLGFAYGGMVIGDLALNRSGNDSGTGLRVLSFFVAMVVIVALGAVPVLGAITGPLVLCLGLGAWTLAIFNSTPSKSATSTSN